MNLNLMKALIKRTKMQIELAASGEECLKLTRRKAFDIILMDHMMPQLDGVETLKILRSEVNNINKNTTVVALTANAISGSREMYLGYGFDDYLSKPILADKLDELLGRLLPVTLVKYEKVNNENKAEIIKTETTTTYENYLYIDSELGLQYCLNMPEFYREAMKEFCEQVREYLPRLEEIVEKKDWKQYAVVTHALKGNAKNIGAVAFSDLSLQHEKAAKEENEDFILNEYSMYMQTLQKLLEKVEKQAET
jgi:CheY-like chemotaxis protein